MAIALFTFAPWFWLALDPYCRSLCNTKASVFFPPASAPFFLLFFLSSVPSSSESYLVFHYGLLNFNILNYPFCFHLSHYLGTLIQ